jgi:uncharacterized protein YbbC (DUF1343 family)
MLHVTDPMIFRSVATYVALIALARIQAPEQFQFLERVYEFESTRIAFDLLTGSSQARLSILADARVSETVELVAPVDPAWKTTVEEAEARADAAAA